LLLAVAEQDGAADGEVAEAARLLRRILVQDLEAGPDAWGEEGAAPGDPANYSSRRDHHTTP
jgi:hypothetical protein